MVRLIVTSVLHLLFVVVIVGVLGVFAVCCIALFSWLRYCHDVCSVVVPGEPETDNVKYRFITRFKNWGDGPFDWLCHGKRVSMVCIFAVGDMPLLATRPELFANKFYIDYEPLVFDCMEQLLFRRLRDEVRSGSMARFDTSLYAAQEFVWNHI